MTVPSFETRIQVLRFLCRAAVVPARLRETLRRFVLGGSRQSQHLLRSVCAVLVLLAACGLSASAQQGGFEDLLGPNAGRVHVPPPEFVVTLNPHSAKPGEEVTLAIQVKLPEGYYIENTGKGGASTQITVEPTGLEQVDSGWIADRQPKIELDPILNERVSKYYDHVMWKKRYRLLPGFAPDKVTIKGELNGQYCGGGQCTPIRSQPIEATLAEGLKTAVSPLVYDYAERPHKGKTKPVILRYQLSSKTAKPGEKVKVSITAKLDEGWHIFSLTHKGEGGLATEIEIEESTGLKPLGAGFMADEKPETEQPEPGINLEVHNHLVTWWREFEVLPGTGPGEYSVSGSITFQVCETKCLPPRPTEFKLPFDGDVDPTLNPPKDADYARGKHARAEAKPQDKGLFAFMLLAMGWGFVSLLTPCVFPMVPITVSFFLKQSESQHSRPLLLASVYCLTIVGTFSLIGVGVTAIFGAGNTLNALATGAVVNLCIGIIFTAFAFNMLGMFEIRVPSSLINWTAQGEAAGGYLGAIFMALTFTLTSFTCTFAFAGSVLVAAARGEYFWPLVGMAAFGFAFAMPFFVLALLPGLVKKLPKSGGWMNSVKVVMGLIELAFAFKFFSIVDQQWNSVPILFDFTNVMMAWAVLSLAVGLYLMGLFHFVHDTPPKGLSVPRVMLAVSFQALGGLFGIGLITPERESWLVDQLVSFAPARVDDKFGLDFDVGVADATAHQQPLFVDFTGVFCTNCRLMEKRMARGAIHKKLDRYVGLKLYTDRVPGISDTGESARILKRNIELQSKLFGDVTLPSYAVITPDGKTILSSYVGLEQKDGEFAKFLDEGWKKWQSIHAQTADQRGEERVERQVLGAKD